ncbi:DUF2303 family protein [Gordonia sp. N1V]|uniref:DUF2303 family protein n=1 Tax=Gordonia sp. N1V TaxID=3034163 RepID=UPI0023E10017|nr:DUF2303 family protein [Gordonia sp. N1V]MDF3280857.1 DUF2303 family protein [Gordonia sp. N1V]
MSNEDITEAGAVADIVKNSVNRPTEVPGHPGLLATVYSRDEVLTVGSYERYREEPRRQRGTFDVHDVPSFLEAIRLRHDNDTTVYANVDNRSLTAVLNDQGWRDHRVNYAPEFSREFAAWQERSGKYVSQRDFAEFLEDRAFDLVEPEPAELISIARQFKATRKVQFESGTKLQSGDIQFVYSEETGAGSGSKGKIDIPETFVIGVPVFKGTEKISITATLRYNIDRDAGLQLSYRLLFLDDLIEASLQQQIIEPVREGLVSGNFGSLLLASAPGVVGALD